MDRILGGADNKTAALPVTTAELGLWINRSEKAHTLDSFIL